MRDANEAHDQGEGDRPGKDTAPDPAPPSEKNQAEPIGEVKQDNDKDGPPNQEAALDPVQPDESQHQHSPDAGSGPDAARFRAWLVQQQDHPDGLVRTLAYHVADDDTWPEDAATQADLEHYIAGQPGVDQRSIDGLVRAWSLWQDPDQDRALELASSTPDPFDDLAKATAQLQTEESAPDLDLDQVRAWITTAYPSTLLDDSGVLHVSATDAWSGRRFPVGQVNRLLEYVAQLDREGRAGIYLRAATMRPDAGKGRGKAADSVELVGLWSDIDLAGPGHKHDPAKHGGLTLPPDEAAGRAIVERAGLPAPSVWIHSGGGLIIASAATVVLSLLTLLVAELNSTKSLGP
jgi:hypothetical protein